jgi:hypothetical protein
MAKRCLKAGYVNCDQPNPPRPESYTERLLATGVVAPYFIWPNLDPYRSQDSLAGHPRPAWKRLSPHSPGPP